MTRRTEQERIEVVSGKNVYHWHAKKSVTLYLVLDLKTGRSTSNRVRQMRELAFFLFPSYALPTSRWPRNDRQTVCLLRVVLGCSGAHNRLNSEIGDSSRQNKVIFSIGAN